MSDDHSSRLAHKVEIGTQPDKTPTEVASADAGSEEDSGPGDGDGGILASLNDDSFVGTAAQLNIADPGVKDALSGDALFRKANRRSGGPEESIQGELVDSNPGLSHNVETQNDAEAKKHLSMLYSRRGTTRKLLEQSGKSEHFHWHTLTNSATKESRPKAELKRTLTELNLSGPVDSATAKYTRNRRFEVENKLNAIEWLEEWFWGFKIQIADKARLERQRFELGGTGP